MSSNAIADHGLTQDGGSGCTSLPTKKETRCTVTILNEDYIDTVERLWRAGRKVDLVLTSPPYNTNRKQGRSKTLLNVQKDKKQPWVRYDTVQDFLSQEEYCSFFSSFIQDMDGVVAKNGVLLVNLSYGNENPDGIWLAIAEAIQTTVWTIADTIVWQKRNAMPNNCSPNRLTRICEFVFVFARKNELATFHANKSVSSVRASGQLSYSSSTNIIKAKNNDGSCPYNKATFSSDLVIELLRLYAPKGGTVFDPFIGSGTTGIGAHRLGLNCIGSEISERQCRWAVNRLISDGARVVAPDFEAEHDEE